MVNYGELPKYRLKLGLTPHRHNIANNINMQCKRTILLSNIISIPPGCGLKLVVSVYSSQRYERYSQYPEGML